MGLCRSASGSHPAPVPRCCGGAARRKGVRPCRVVMSVSARAPSSGQAARSAFRKVAATDTERARERRKQRRDWPALSPVHGGGKGRASLSGFRSMAGSSPAQRTVWTNPALWSATNQENFCFLRAGAGDGAAVLYGGRRAGAGQFPHGGGKSPMGWFGERREKRPRRGESPGRQRERTVPVSTDRQGCRIGPRRQRSLSRRGLRRTAPCWKRERPAVCAAPKPYRVSACPGPTDHCILVTIRDRAVVCRSSFPNKARWEGEGV